MERGGKSWQRGGGRFDLSLGDEDTAAVHIRSRNRGPSRRAGEPGRAGANIGGLIERILRFLRLVGRWGFTIRQSSAASSAPWSKARWLRSTIARVPVGNRRSRSKPRLGWCRWRAGKRRTWAIPTNCGRQGFSPAMPASTDRPQGHACLAHLAQGTVCKILDEDEVKPHKVRYYLEQRDPDLLKWPKCCAFIAK